MVLAPVANWFPATVNEAVAVAPVPARLALPNELLPTEKLTEPAGVAVPVAACTVAVSTVDPVTRILAGATLTAVVVAARGLTLQNWARLLMSIEPSPVARS